MSATVPTGLLVLTPATLLIPSNAPIYSGNTLSVPLSSILGAIQNGSDTTTTLLYLAEGLPQNGDWGNSFIINQTLATFKSNYAAITTGPSASSAQISLPTVAGNSPYYAGNSLTVPISSILGFTQNGVDQTTSIVFLNMKVPGARSSNQIQCASSVTTLTTAWGNA